MNLLVICLAALVSATTPLGETAEPRTEANNLLTHATRVCSASDWERPCYEWLPNGKVLAFTRSGALRGSVLYEVDTATGRSRPLKRLNDRLLRTGAARNGAVSPDGRWIVLDLRWRDNGPMPTDDAVLASLDGRLWKGVPNPAFDSLAAWADDRRWYLFDPGHQQPRSSLRQYGRDGFARAYAVPVDEALPRTLDTGLTALFVSGSGRPTIVLCSPFTSSRIDAFEFPRPDEPTGTSARHTVIPKTEEVNIRGVRASPDGKRLAWDISFDRADEIWVSSIDGSGMRRFGWKQLSSDFLPRPLTVRWTPDGRRISFLHEGVLWTVPVE